MYIFFFKQKTAYEMRISDWSSDVCSSDLWRKWLSVDIAWKVQRASHDPFGDGAECDLLGVAIREGGRRLLDRPSQILEFGVKDIARLRPTSRSGEVE